ncbi:MAG TPA: Sec-independent protein translocase subunit TatA [Nocardioidaceae bacterium]|nr:Sec-independent protein translocase subunit TatA [Nocardioidaceae bacterium]
MGSIGPTEIILVLLVLVLLFGARKLPELARGSGRALRIFKAETKGLTDDDEKEQQATDDAPQQQPRQQLPPSPPSQTANGTESGDSNRASRDQQQS